MQPATSSRTLKARVKPPDKYLMPLVLSRVKLNWNYQKKKIRKTVHLVVLLPHQILETTGQRLVYQFLIK